MSHSVITKMTKVDQSVV